MNVLIQAVDFETVLPVWKYSLWPGRESKIEPLSCINLEGSIDPKILLYEPKFFAAQLESKLIGVVSCHRIDKKLMRIRGLYVEEAYRNRNIGKALVERVLEESVAQNTNEVFGLIRVMNETYFKRRGFNLYKPQDGYEFGPHLIMKKTTST